MMAADPLSSLLLRLLNVAVDEAQPSPNHPVEAPAVVDAPPSRTSRRRFGIPTRASTAVARCLLIHAFVGD